MKSKDLYIISIEIINASYFYKLFKFALNCLSALFTWQKNFR